MKIENINITDIKPYKNNPRKNDKAIEKVAESIRLFGFKNPVILDKHNVIVCGHTRVKAAEKLGIKTIPCIYADDLSNEQIKAFRLIDNKTAEYAQWDFNALAVEIEDISKNIDFDLSAFDFEELVIDNEDFSTDFSLPDGEKNEIGQMSFVLHEKQKELIHYAISIIGENTPETFGNTNKMGNALYEVVRQWAELKR